ncbi:hypothetical protein NitYY0826_C1332 [Nitratiruptor sp. YY08-26]|uniref:COG3400 family protein n=1 Tax=unclassified Nitratiruptor TaxID=2624044 RepID=UPI0019160623|nr:MULTISPECIES: TrkA C-terminal domain-containing protein [unclassified Nitratiruptor]BCD62456.1 hypothetical protein NitYY0813_C1330 [Nitratiruptor sp. YY08-13]BCD66392.1 hypothetical protein NitYY0826_C1332 [Nitratiruptor sp. YY08-26]
MQVDVLILADGIVAKHLLQRIVKNYVTTNRYHVVYMDDSIKPDIDNENFLFYKLDPTSFVKLSQLFKRRFTEVVIVLANKIDTLASFENVRKLDPNVTTVILDRWDLQIEGKNFIRLDANEILANRVVDHLPNVPVIAQNVGLGEGEIMEVLVPFGSAYVYRHVGSIEQKNWKIAAIYRNNKLILPTPDLMIYPNDLLLLIGEPSVLKEVFKSIKREVGQFPMPFGLNSYLFIDMEALSTKSLRHMVLGAIYVHKRFKDKKLIIRIINPNNLEFLDFIRKYDSEDVEVIIDYYGKEIFTLMKKDMKSFRVGLFITHAFLFEKSNFRKFLYTLSIPVLALSDKSMDNLKEVGLILSKNSNVEKISSIVFDIAIQLKLSLKLFQYSEEEKNEKVIEHFENLATIFSKPITIKKSKTNPIREIIQNENNILMVYPFSKKVADAKIWNIFCTDPEALFYRLNQYPQIFIPTS